MKDYIALSISEMECDDVTFEIDFEAWTDTSGPGSDESYIEVKKATLWCGKLNIDVTELMQRSQDLPLLIEAYLDQTSGD
jgi:hypothetical protein